jgi:hypothetical protein
MTGCPRKVPDADQEIAQRRASIRALEDSVRHLKSKHVAELETIAARVQEEQRQIESLEKEAATKKPRPMSIAINKDGVFVGGHKMAGVVRWDILRDPSAGLTEVAIVLATDKLTVDLEAPGSHPNRIL